MAAGVVSPGQSVGGALGAQLVVLLLSAGLVRVGDIDVYGLSGYLVALTAAAVVAAVAAVFASRRRITD